MTQFSRASSLAHFDEFATKNGLDYQQMLKLAGLPGDVLEHPESLISYQRVEKLMDRCAGASGNPLFGLEYGLFQGVDIFGPLLYLLRSAQTVQESLIELTHFYHLYSSGALVTIEQHGSLVVLSYKPTLESEATSRQAIEVDVDYPAKLFGLHIHKGFVNYYAGRVDGKIGRPEGIRRWRPHPAIRDHLQTQRDRELTPCCRASGTSAPCPDPVHCRRQ